MSELEDGTRVTVPIAESGETGLGEWILKPVHKVVLASWRSDEWQLVFVPMGAATPHTRTFKGEGWLLSGQKVTARRAADGSEGDGEWVVTPIVKYSNSSNWRGSDWELIWTPIRVRQARSSRSNGQSTNRKAVTTSKSPAKRTSTAKAAATTRAKKATPAAARRAKPASRRRVA